ncbi:MAG: TonB-dependent receptor [Prevotella sp.]|nr:TonB-dependent receptor [Prevotella sp.]
MSQAQQVSLSNTRLTLRTAFTEIEKQTEMSVDYNRKTIDVNKTVSLPHKEGSLSEIMTALLQGTGCAYVVRENHIVISKMPVITQQTRKNVTGLITDQQGEPIIGANIVEKGTTNGTVTGVGGNFRLQVENDAVLQISYIGYLARDINTVGKTSIDIILQEDTQALEEVVVVGYGTQKKVNLTGSVEVVKGTELVKRPVMSTTLALQGLASGVTITSNSGQPGGENETVRIRGIGTLNNNDPLVLVDGVVSPLNAVNPYDIESVSILKDAASASIYGSRAANGVILITTKRAESNRFSISLTGNIGLQYCIDIPKYLGSIDFMELNDLASANDSRNASTGKPGGVTFGQDFINNWKANMATDPFKYPNTNWADVSYNQPAFQQQYNLSFTGGTDKLKAFASLNYQDQTGVITDMYLNRYRLRLNTDYQFSNKFSVGIDITARHSIVSEPYNAGYNIGEIRRTPPMNAYKTADGHPAFPEHGSVNPWATTQEKYVGYNRSWTQEGLINLKAGYAPFQSLRFDFSVAPKINHNTNKNYANQVDYYDANGVVVNTSPQRRTISMNKNYTLNADIKLLANFNKSFGDHNLSALGGFQQITNYYEYVSAYREVSLFDYDQIASFPALNQTGNGNANDWALQSYFSRINYDFAGKYLIEANVRYDGSSRFAKGYQWGMFPSFSGGWRFSQEAFMENIEVVSNGKLRVSWGQLGNQMGVGNYDFAMNINLNQPVVFNQQVADGYAAVNYAVKDLTWETTAMSMVGVDLAFFNNKIEFIFDYYNKKTTDILMPMDIPSFMGYGNSPNQNAGIVENKGWDLNVTYNDRMGDLNWRISATLSDVHNKILDMKGIVRNFEVNTNREGYPINSLWGLQADGLFSSWDAAQAHPIRQYGSFLQGGDIKYVDQLTVDSDGDGIPDTGNKILDGEDFVVIGNTIPRYTYSLDLFAQYKGFDFGAFFQGVGKRDGYLRDDLAWAFNNNGNVQQWQKDGMWREGQTDARYPRMFKVSQNNTQVSSFWVQNASYLRLKNLQLGYTIPQKALNATFIRKVRLYISCNNVFTIKHMIEGMDPEQSDFNARNSIPLLRTYSFGFNLDF